MLTRLLLYSAGKLKALRYALYYTYDLFHAAFWSGHDIPWDPYNLEHLPREAVAGKVLIITGASSGCGEEVLRCIGELCCTYDKGSQGETRIYLFVRNVEKMEKLLQRLRREWATTRTTRLGEDVEDTLDEEKYGLKITIVQCDMDSLQSVRKAAIEFLVKEGGSAANPSMDVRLDVLFANAGVCSDPYVDGKTQDGWERNFGVNTLSHHALIRYLLPALQRTKGRVVMTSTISTFWMRPVRGLVKYYFHPFRAALQDHPPHIHIDTYTQAALHWDVTAAYARSKLASLLLARYINGQTEDATITLVQPGVLGTSIFLPRTALQQRIMDFMTFPAYTQPLREGQKRERGYAGVNLLFAAFGMESTQAQLAFVREWCRVVDVREQDQCLCWGDGEVLRELQKLQVDLGEWADEVVDAV